MKKIIKPSCDHVRELNYDAMRTLMANAENCQHIKLKILKPSGHVLEVLKRNKRSVNERKKQLTYIITLDILYMMLLNSGYQHDLVNYLVHKD